MTSLLFTVSKTPMFKNNAYIKKNPKTRQNPEGSVQVRPRVQLLQVMDFIFFSQHKLSLLRWDRENQSVDIRIRLYPELVDRFSKYS